MAATSALLLFIARHDRTRSAEKHMSPKTKAIAIVAAAAGIPFFTARLWWPHVPYLPLYDVIIWAIYLGPALVAAFKAGPQAARAGLVVQAVVSVVLLK